MASSASSATRCRKSQASAVSDVDACCLACRRCAGVVPPMTTCPTSRRKARATGMISAASAKRQSLLACRV